MMYKVRVDIDDIDGELDAYIDYKIKIITYASNQLKHVATINGAFVTIQYYINNNKNIKILYCMIY